MRLKTLGSAPQGSELYASFGLIVSRFSRTLLSSHVSHSYMQRGPEFPGTFLNESTSYFRPPHLRRAIDITT